MSPKNVEYKSIMFYNTLDILPGKAVGENCPIEGAAREAKTHPKNTKTNSLIRFIVGGCYSC